MTPWPSDPFGSEVPVYDLDGSGRHFIVGNGPDNLTLGQQQHQADQALRSLEGRLGMDSPAPLDNTITPQWSTQDSLIDTNQLWLTIAPLTNQLAYVELHAPVQDQTTSSNPPSRSQTPSPGARKERPLWDCRT